MGNRLSLLFGFILLAAGLFFNFQKKPAQVTIQQLMEEAVQKKIQRYTDIRTERCTETILKEANRLADSTIIAQAKALKVLQDTVTRPVAPVRPDRPELLAPIDSSFPTPILQSGELPKPIDQ